MRSVIFYAVLGATGGLLLFYALVSKERSRAIVAEVEPQKTAISFHKPVRVKSLHVKPGARVKEGDLLLQAERLDLDLDILQVISERDQLLMLRSQAQREESAKRELLKLRQVKEMQRIDADLLVLQTRFLQDSMLQSQLQSTSQPRDNYERMKKELMAEASISQQTYQAELKRLATSYEKERRINLEKQERLDDQLMALEREKAALSQYAPFDGTIGSVSVQLQELVPSFKTILSIYHDQPNIIKAYMSEVSSIEVSVGEKVTVESSNRQYAIAGEIVEIGSRIVSYPKQMNPLNQQQMWGQELFVRIPDENRFLNGEKVFVILEEKK